MAHIIGDRVLETSTTTGTGAFTLAGAVTGFRAFSSICANGSTVYYYIEAVNESGVPTGDWETGFGTWGTGNILTRTTVRASSNADAAVSFAAGTKRVGLSVTARQVAGFSAGSVPDVGSSLGYLDIPQNSQSAAYTLVLADAGKHILHPTADTSARTFTIPAHSSVAYPIGTAITFVNQASAGVMTIAITSDTMRLAGAGTTGSRTLAANGVATAIKLTNSGTPEWVISGSGLS